MSSHSTLSHRRTIMLVAAVQADWKQPIGIRAKPEGWIMKITVGYDVKNVLFLTMEMNKIKKGKYMMKHSE